MALHQHKRAVGIFSRRAAVEQALEALQSANFPLERVTVIARELECEKSIGGVRESNKNGNQADEGAATGAVAGGAVGGITGLLVGIGAIAIPTIGPIMLAGAAATALATTLAGGAIGAVAGGLLGALIGLGIPEEQAKVYHERLLRGDYLVMVEGTDEEIRLANSILRQRGIEEWAVYHIPSDDTINTDFPVIPAVDRHRRPA